MTALSTAGGTANGVGYELCVSNAVLSLVSAWSEVTIEQVERESALNAVLLC
jgi:hypothetical protein